MIKVRHLLIITLLYVIIIIMFVSIFSILEDVLCSNSQYLSIALLFMKRICTYSLLFICVSLIIKGNLFRLMMPQFKKPELLMIFLIVSNMLFYKIILWYLCEYLDPYIPPFEYESVTDIYFGTQYNYFTIDLLLLYILYAIIASAMEELFYRGILLKALLLNKYNGHVSIIISAIVFGLFHFHPIAMIGAFIFGIYIGYVYLKYQSLTICILAHIAYNLLDYSFFLNDAYFIKYQNYILYATILLFGLTNYFIFSRKSIKG